MLKKRTGSTASRVGPAVTSTRSPAISCGASARRTASNSTAGAGSRPRPVSPQASRPLSGSSTVTPKRRSVSRLRCVMGLSYIPVFIAGATSLGQRAASSVVVSISSAIPAAIFAITFAVAGATMNTSAFFASDTCSTLYSKLRSNVSIATRLLTSVSKVSGVTNCAAFPVIMTCTSAAVLPRSLASCAALYAAMPPLTPKTIVLPSNMAILPPPGCISGPVKTKKPCTRQGPVSVIPKSEKRGPL